MANTRSMQEMAELYARFSRETHSLSLDLGAWLPTMRKHARPVVPGELVFIMSGTGVGKTMALQEIARRTKLQTLLFEMELPDVLTFERFVQGHVGTGGDDVERTYRNGEEYDVSDLSHIHVCGSSNITFAEMVQEITTAPITPRLVLVDYLGLMRGEGRSRYEKVSNCAESLKNLAKQTDTIVIAATQRHRPQGNSESDTTTSEPQLHDANGSGDIEQASDLMLGIWRDPNNPRERGFCQILKNRKGTSGYDTKIELDVRGQHMRMSEMVPDSPDWLGDNLP